MGVARNALRSIGLVSVLGALAVAGASALTPHVASNASFSFHCTSSGGSSDTTYNVSADVPATVEQGATFTLANVVVTGTPDAPLLIKHVDFSWSVTPNATPVDPLVMSLDGPGSLDPPGPPAPAGVPNSSPPQSYALVATGAVGSQIDFGMSQVVAVVLNPADTSQQVDVTCNYVRGGPFASTTIVEAASSTTSTTDTLPASSSSTSSSSTSSSSTVVTLGTSTSTSTTSTSSTTVAPTSTTIVAEGTTVASSTSTSASTSTTARTGDTVVDAGSTSSSTVAAAADTGTLPFTGSSRTPVSIAWVLLVVGLAFLGAGHTRRRA